MLLCHKKRSWRCFLPFLTFQKIVLCVYWLWQRILCCLNLMTVTMIVIYVWTCFHPGHIPSHTLPPGNIPSHPLPPRTHPLPCKCVMCVTWREETIRGGNNDGRGFVREGICPWFVVWLPDVCKCVVHKRWITKVAILYFNKKYSSVQLLKQGLHYICL